MDEGDSRCQIATMCVCIRLVDDPVIVGELAFRGEYVIAGGRPSREASISETRRGEGGGRGWRAGEARGRSALSGRIGRRRYTVSQLAIQISGSAVHHVDRIDAECVKRGTRFHITELIGLNVPAFI